MDSHESFVKSKFKAVSQFIPENSKILDIGCGDGDIINFLNKSDYYGIDGDEENIKILLNKKIKAKRVDFNKEKIPFNKEKFDFILMLDILEHIVNPKGLLKEAKTRLKENGKLIVTLPNDYHILNKIRFVFNKHLTENPFAPYGHLHYFPIKSGENFLENCDFNILKEIYLAPIKPAIIPQPIKKILIFLFPQAFVRDVLYILS